MRQQWHNSRQCKLVLRLGFFASSAFAVPSLARLTSAGIKPVQLWTTPNRPSGRGMKPQSSPPALFAREHDIPLRQPESLKGEAGKEETKFVRSLALDLILTAAYGKLLPPSLLGAAKIGGVNLHASLLPRWRGADPIRHAILAGDKATGISLMQMEAGLDCGAVYASARCAIGKKNAETLSNELAQLAADLLLQHLPAIVAGRVSAVAQDETKATYANKIPPEKWRIDWQQPAQQIALLIQAGAPKPAAWCERARNKKPLRLALLAARAHEGKTTGKAGQVINKQGFIACGEGSLEVLELRPAGKQAMTMDAFMRGRGLLAGERLA